MSRIHGRYGDWTLELHDSHGAYGYPVYTDPVFLLSLRVTREQAQELVNSPRYRGNLSFRHDLVTMDGTLHAENIEVTRNEAEQIRRGAHPMDVLFGWPELGYRLVVVPDRI